MTIDEIFASMPEEDAATGRDYLVIDPAARSITVPESEKIFGVEGDEDAARKYFICPRYVGDNLDLAGMFLTVYWRNAGGDEDGYMVEDVQTKGEYVTFSWLLSEKAVAYKGAVQFAVCADLPNTATKRRPDWNTTLAEGEVLEGMDPDLGDLETDSSDVLTQLREMVTAQTAAVEATGAAQVAEVKDQGTNTTQEAVAAIQAQGAATNASIPADYTALAATVDRLTRDRAAAIVCAAEGTAIQVADASNDPLQGLRIFGRSTQDGTPTPEAPVEIVSTPAPVVGVYGKNLVNASAMLRDDFMTEEYGVFTLTKGTQRFSKTQDCYIPANRPVCFYAERLKYTGSADFWMGFNLTFEDGTGSTVGLYVNGAPHTARTYTKAIRKIGLFMSLDDPAGTEIQFKNLQVELGTAPTDYEPYTGQALTITTPGSLPGIPVASGGNYTDANGQQWIADEVDLARGVYVQRVKTGNLYDYFDKYCTQADNTKYSEDVLRFDFGYAFSCKVKTTVLCNRLAYEFAHGDNAAAVRALEGVSSHTMSDIISIFINKSRLATADLAGLKVYLERNATAVQYALATPVETPLTDVELQAFLAMHSNKPTTTVLNDAGAHMVLEYAADPKTYIDNKLAALVAANS